MQITSSPHIRDKVNTQNLMFTVIIALLPAIIFSLFIFRTYALITLTTAIVVSLTTEALISTFLTKKPAFTDGSAVLTGILLAMSLPPSLPWWTTAIGSFFAIAIVKQAFGGLGMNIFNPALAARAFLLASYPVLMTTWIKPFVAVTEATPLAIAKTHAISLSTNYSLWQSFWGFTSGSLGETSALALLAGGIFLIARKVISWIIPLVYIGTMAILCVLFGEHLLFNLLNGGLLLGAFFMATDYVTSPVTDGGKVVFGIGLGILTFVIRMWGGYPEGVCYAILLMNAVVPLLDKIRFQKGYFRS